jgi:adenosylhomocysteine nucleosidase
LEQGAVYQAGAVAYRDIDASALGFERGITPFLDLAAAVPMALRIPGVPVATLSTGGAVISGPAYDAIAQDMVDMETFATLRACQRFGVPLIALRGISDGAAPLEGLHSWTEYLHIVDERLAQAVDLLRAGLAGGLAALRLQSE